ncbi:unnamed protein product [Porites evermanni]|uniref:Uncharacterized protein n=1 Tax=Porites evermanni TaxID=104178 RepID=A0ABN8MI08_9CNID|nr:unnamed protein product [Porites evermanni]
MAARRGRFSRKEVIEQVLVESVETEEDDGPEVSLNDILETLISNFTALRCSISNYTHFREEARQLMRAIKAFNVGSTCFNRMVNNKHIVVSLKQERILKLKQCIEESDEGESAVHLVCEDTNTKVAEKPSVQEPST